MEDRERLHADIADLLIDLMGKLGADESNQILSLIASKFNGKDLNELLALCLEDSHKELAKGLARNKHQQFPEWMIAQINGWMNSDDPQDTALAISIMYHFKHESNSSHLIRALGMDGELLEMSIDTSSQYLDTVMDHLLPQAQNPKLYRKVVASFAQAGDAEIKRLVDALEDNQELLIDILLLNKEPRSAARLLTMLEDSGAQFKGQILRGLQRREDARLSKHKLELFIQHEGKLLEEVSFKMPNSPILDNALLLERNEIVERILGYCFLHSRERVLLNAQKELFLSGENKMALCIEALQASLPLSLFKPIRRLLEARTDLPIDDDLTMIRSLGQHKNSLSQWLVLLAMDFWNNDELKNNDMKAIKVQRIDRVMLLKKTALFEEIRDNRLLDIADLLEEVQVAKGDVVFSKDDEGDALYIITNGKIAIEDGGHVLARFGSGDFFGDLSLLDPAPRSADARALEDSNLLMLDQSAIYELMYDHIEVVKGIIGALCKRIRNQNKIYVEARNNVSEQI